MSTTVDVIESYVQVLMYEPADELGYDHNNNKNEYEYLKERPTIAYHYLEDFSHENDKHCTIMRDKVDLFNCNSTDSIECRACLTYEMTQCNKCKSNVCVIE